MKAGLAAGVTEAVAVVTPMEVIKIRLQAQHHSMADPLDIPKYRNAAHALYTVVKEEGAGALYRGVTLTALRQGSNQAGPFSSRLTTASCCSTLRCALLLVGRLQSTRYDLDDCWQTERYHRSHMLTTLSLRVVNFTAYTELRAILQNWQSTTDLPSYQTMAIGLASGAMGPLSNAPIDTIKTRLQKTPGEPGETAVSRVTRIASDMWKQEGTRSFYKGITPRIMRVAPGQAVTFTVYEYLKSALERSREMLPGGQYEE